MTASQRVTGPAAAEGVTASGAAAPASADPGAPTATPSTLSGDAAPPPAERASRSGWVWASRGLLVIVLLWSAYMLLHEQPERCRDELTEAGKAVEVCAPLEATSPEVLLVLLIIGLLLLPELTELEVGGVVTLRRAVAEARGEATQARAEAAEARLASTQLAAQVTQLTANPTATATSASSTTITNIVQARETAEAQQQLNSRTDAPTGAPVTPTPGESSLVAFTAGLAGLASGLPPLDEGVGVAIVGLTLTTDRNMLEATHNPFEVADEFVERAEQLLNDPDLQPGEIVTVVAPEGLVMATLALAGDEQVVGGLAAVLQPTPPLSDTRTDDPLDVLAAGVRVAAGAYAQLLVDLLGEQPVEGW